MSKIKRIGILTGGGDCPGLNAVIRAVVATARFKYQIDVLGIRDGFSGLVRNIVEPLDLNSVSGILPHGGTILGTSNRDNPFKYPVITAAGHKDYHDMSGSAVETIKNNALDVLIAVGGDGTQIIAQEFFEKYHIPVIGVPKTIDNDLDGTDVTFGFDTAVNTATYSIDRIHSTAESHHRVMVIEVMGRHAGWIALQSGIAGGADVILIPEMPYRLDKIVKKIEERRGRGKRFSLVVVAEGAKPEGGEEEYYRKAEDPNEPKRLGGISRLVGDQIEELTGIETRFTILGHVQRGGSPTPFDRILATRFGYHAVEAAINGQFGYLVGLRGQDIKTTLIKDAIAEPRRVKPDSDLVMTARALGTSLGI